MIIGFAIGYLVYIIPAIFVAKQRAADSSNLLIENQKQLKKLKNNENMNFDTEEDFERYEELLASEAKLKWDVKNEQYKYAKRIEKVEYTLGVLLPAILIYFFIGLMPKKEEGE